MTEKVYVVFEQQLEAHDNTPEVVWQNISLYQDRSDAYEYVSTVDDRFEVDVMEKTINSSESLTEEQKEIVEESSDAFDNIAEIFDCDREFVEDMAKVAFEEENSETTSYNAG